MITLFTPTGFLEIAIFLFAIVAFVLAVRFFMDSRKRLEELFPETINPRKLLPLGFDRSGFLIPKTAEKKQEVITRPLFKPSETASSDNTKKEIKELRFQLQQQQVELTKALEKIAGINTDASERKTTQVWEEQKKLETLRRLVEEKEAEIQRLKGQGVYMQRLQEHYEEVQTEFNKLQEKMQQMEKQAWQAAELSIQLEHAEQAQLQIETTLHRKEEKLRELTQENQHLHDAFNELEGRLAEANLQRQQLLKKVQLLEGLNADMTQMAEASRKLKTEIARVAELESLLNLMTEGKSR